MQLSEQFPKYDFGFKTNDKSQVSYCMWTTWPRKVLGQNEKGLDIDDVTKLILQFATGYSTN
jgi:hypothetical protein